jgi:alkylated DNA repair dioxygenase AlkB
MTTQWMTSVQSLKSHEDATDNASSQQPGYRYATVTMKARPLSLLPQLDDLSKDLAEKRQIKKWNIGVHPLLYRDSTDSIGDHADDDQGETCIFCVVAVGDPRRRVRIHVFQKLTNRSGFQEGDEIIELFLGAGDAYEMDGVMQQSYSHCVPKMKRLQANANTSENKVDINPLVQRICVVFRRGVEKYFARDTGTAARLQPKQPFEYTLGHIPGTHQPDACFEFVSVSRSSQMFTSYSSFLGLVFQGNYTRRQLIELGAINVSASTVGVMELRNDTCLMLV